MTSKPKSEIRRPQIVRSLYLAIQEHGVALPSYDQIAQHGDATRQLIRHYFANSEDLAIALCDYLADSYRELLSQGILKADKSERLKTFLDFYFDFLAEDGLAKPADDSVYDALFAYARSSERVRRNLHDQYTLLQMTISHEIQISHQTLPAQGCRELGYLMVSMMYGHWKMVASLGFSEEYNRVTREAIDRLIESYVARYVVPEE